MSFGQMTLGQMLQLKQSHEMPQMLKLQMTFGQKKGCILGSIETCPFTAVSY